MLKINRILVPTDFSDCSTPALDLAVRLAKEHDAEICLFHAIVLFEEDLVDLEGSLPGSTRLGSILADYSVNSMSRLIRDHGHPDVVFNEVNRRGISAASLIVDYAREAEIDLIVMGTHGRRGIRKMFLGSVASEVIRSAPCSVLTVRNKGKRTELENMTRILAPVDFSDQGKTALRVAAQLARRDESRIQLLHVLGDILHPAFYNMGAIRLTDLQPDVLGKAESELRKHYHAVVGFPSQSATCHVKEGHAAREIIRFASDQGCDLIVMATHGHTDKRHFLIGGTTEKVISGAECPVLVIRTLGRALLGSAPEVAGETTV